MRNGDWLDRLIVGILLAIWVVGIIVVFLVANYY